MLTPPDPIPPLVRLTEDEAVAALLVIAAMNGMYVFGLADIYRADDFGRNIGFVVSDGQRFWNPNQRSWAWIRHTSEYGWIAPREIGFDIVPLGRIDRGLSPHPVTTIKASNR